jgi:hypothetical protein
VRAAFFLLLFANLAFLAWAEWIDVPQPAASNDVYAKLPRLKLVGEDPADRKGPSSSGRARKTALQADAATPVAARCVSVGPFDDEAGATRGISLLRDKGLSPRQRSQQGEVPKGFWVYIGGLKTDQDVSGVLLTLQQAHVDDAKVMQDSASSGEAGHRVSVGVFSDRDRADRRAQSIKKLGLEPTVAERKVPGTVFWADVDVPPGTAAPTVQDLAAAASAASFGLGGNSAGGTAAASSTGGLSAAASSGATSAGASSAGGSSSAAFAGLIPAAFQVTPCPSGASPTNDGTAPLPASPNTAPYRTKVATGSSRVP